MEGLNFLRFWKPSYGTHKENPNQPCCGNRVITEIPKSLMVSDQEFEEGEDSFIDLELPLHEFKDQRNGNVSSDGHEQSGDVNDKKRFYSKEDEDQTRSLSPNEHFSKRKIIPIEPSSKPQSPIALLKSAPKFCVFTLKKSKSMANTHKTEKTEFIDISAETPKHEKHSEIKFKIQESPNPPVFTRKNSLRKTEDSSSDDSSKRLPKDLIQNYLKVIKPLYIKASKKNSQSEKTRVSADLSVSSLAASPATTVYSMKEKQGNLSAGVRGICKQLGKSRSASAAAVAASPISRRDDSLLLQHDGIQSAILHCKKSFNSSRAESSWLSRCTSDSSQEKLSNASSTDSSLLSRVTSNSSYEKLMDSARISSEDGKCLEHLKVQINAGKNC